MNKNNFYYFYVRIFDKRNMLFHEHSITVYSNNDLFAWDIALSQAKEILQREHSMYSIIESISQQ